MSISARTDMLIDELSLCLWADVEDIRKEDEDKARRIEELFSELVKELGL